jgi:hypothetical protein
VRGINRIVYDITSKPPGTIERHLGHRQMRGEHPGQGLTGYDGRKRRRVARRATLKLPYLCMKMRATNRRSLPSGLGGTQCPTRNRKHRNLARRTVAPQQPAAEDALLICCKASGGSREAAPAGPDLSSKTMALESIDPAGSTDAREICCRFLADAAEGRSMTQPLIEAFRVRPRRVTGALQIDSSVPNLKFAISPISSSRRRPGPTSAVDTGLRRYDKEESDDPDRTNFRTTTLGQQFADAEPV